MDQGFATPLPIRITSPSSDSDSIVEWLGIREAPEVILLCSQACEPVILADPKWLPLTGGGVDESWEEITAPYSTVTVVLLCSVD